MSRLLVIIGMLCAVSWAVFAAEPREQAGAGELMLTSSLTELLGRPSAMQVSSIYPPEEPVSWEVYVPAGYESTAPAGLLVYISPTASGRLPERWESVLDEHNLIWVSADDAGNAVHVQRRALFALLAPTLIGTRYAVDHSRIYVAGLSGGGKMASMVATDHAHVFSGAIYICGVEFWDADPRRLERIRRNRYVFLTGEHDQAQRPTRRVYRRYRKAGVSGVKLMVIDGMGHENPDPDVLAEAIGFLDGERAEPKG